MNGYGERCGNANLASVIANLELKLGHTTIGREKLARPDLRLPLHRRTGQPAAAQRPALRRPQRLRAQGRRARERRAEGFRHLRAHQARSGRQPPARAGERSLRPRQHPLQAEAARPGRPPGRGRPPRTAGAHQADGVSKATNWKPPKAPSSCWCARRCIPAALLRRGQLRSHHARRRRRPSTPPPPSRCSAQDGVHSATATGHGPFNALAPVPAQVPLASSTRRSPTSA